MFHQSRLPPPHGEAFENARNASASERLNLPLCKAQHGRWCMGTDSRPPAPYLHYIWPAVQYCTQKTANRRERHLSRGHVPPEQQMHPRPFLPIVKPPDSSACRPPPRASSSLLLGVVAPHVSAGVAVEGRLASCTRPGEVSTNAGTYKETVYWDMCVWASRRPGLCSDHGHASHRITARLSETRQRAIRIHARGSRHLAGEAAHARIA